MSSQMRFEKNLVKSCNASDVVVYPVDGVAQIEWCNDGRVIQTFYREIEPGKKYPCLRLEYRPGCYDLRRDGLIRSYMPTLNSAAAH